MSICNQIKLLLKFKNNFSKELTCQISSYVKNKKKRKKLLLLFDLKTKIKLSKKQLEKKKIRLYQKMCETSRSYEFYECTDVYESLDEFKRDDRNIDKYGFRKTATLNNGEAVIVAWEWRPSYENMVKYNLQNRLTYFREFDDKKISVYKKGDDASYVTYAKEDYLLLDYAGLWNCSNNRVKIMVTMNDVFTVKKIIKNEMKIYKKYLKVRKINKLDYQS